MFINNKAEGQAQWLTPIIPALTEAKTGGSPEVGSLRPSWPTWWNPVSTKNTKISQLWWHVPIVSATQEAEAGELLEPGRWRLQWAKITPLHPSLGNRVRLCLKKKGLYCLMESFSPLLGPKEVSMVRGICSGWRDTCSMSLWNLPFPIHRNHSFMNTLVEE